MLSGSGSKVFGPRPAGLECSSNYLGNSKVSTVFLKLPPGCEHRFSSESVILAAVSSVISLPGQSVLACNMQSCFGGLATPKQTFHAEMRFHTVEQMTV